MVLIFISFGHDAPRGNGRLKISGCVALATFMPSIKKNIDVIVSAPFYDTVHGRNVWRIAAFMAILLMVQHIALGQLQSLVRSGSRKTVIFQSLLK